MSSGAAADHVSRIPLERLAALCDDLIERTAQLYKRGPYHNHKKHLRELEPIFQWLLGDIANPGPYGELTVASEYWHIADSTISRWRKNLESDPKWRPSSKHYGQHRRIFTDEEEGELIAGIQSEYLDQGLFYSDQDFKADVTQFFRKKIETEIQKAERGEISSYVVPNFRCSPTFIQDFRHRWKKSLRRPNFKRRPKISMDQVAVFQNRVTEAIKRYSDEYVFNMDETNFRLVNNKFMTWAVKGVKTVNCRITNDLKEGVTVLATVSKARAKLPLMVLGKGKTDRCLKSYSFDRNTWTYHSPSGWTTETVMLHYLEVLHEHVNHPCALVLDTYAAHRTASVRARAQELGIDLIFIPPGATDLYQPLDRKIFGCLKAYAKRLWRQHYILHKGDRITRKEIAVHITEAWSCVTPLCIESAWSIYDGEDDFVNEETDDDMEDLTDTEYVAVFGC